MPVIKPRTRGKHLVEHRTRLDRDNHETLYAYAAFVEEEPDYVINQLVETVLAKDKEFVACWRQDFLNKAWQGLEAAELNTGQPYCSAVLRPTIEPWRSRKNAFFCSGASSNSGYMSRYVGASIANCGKKLRSVTYTPPNQFAHVTDATPGT